MSDTTDNVHTDVKLYGIRIARLVEDVGLSIILVATIVASGIEINHMWAQRNVMLEDLLLMFIYVETITMVKVYWESGKLPVRMPLYIAIVAIARYLIIDIKEMESLRAVAVSGSILIVSIAVLLVRWGHVRLQYPSTSKAEKDTE